MIEPTGQTPTSAGTSQGAVDLQALLSPASPDSANKGPGKGKAKAPPPPPADDGSSDASTDSDATNVTWDENDPANATSGKKPERRLYTAKVRLYAARTKSSLKLMHLEF